MPLRIPKRRGTILNRHAGAAAGGQPHGSLRASGLALTGKDLGGFARALEDAEDLVQRTSGGLLGLPAGHACGGWVYKYDASGQIRGDDTIG